MGLIINCGGASIKGMNSFVFNSDLGGYERVAWFLTGKSSAEIADEHGLSHVLIRHYALKNKLPYLGFPGKVYMYIFDEAAEEAFINRTRKPPGRPAAEKPPKTPGKPGRPRKEKPVDTAQKLPVGRPRKNPLEALDVVPKRPRGRPRK